MLTHIVFDLTVRSKPTNDGGPKIPHRPYQINAKGNTPKDGNVERKWYGESLPAKLHTDENLCGHNGTNNPRLLTEPLAGAAT